MNTRRTVKVYDKSGKEYIVTPLNGHDMVMHLGYTYTPGRAYTPVDFAPHAGQAPVSSVAEKRHVQAILDGVGTDASRFEQPEEVEEVDTGPVHVDVELPPATPVIEAPTTDVLELPPVAAEAATEEVPVEAEAVPEASDESGAKRSPGRPRKG